MSTFFTVDDYLQPQWTAEPIYKYYFQIIKDGCLLGKMDIRQKPFNLIGRLEDLCDVVIDNQTVSRKHAILQAKKDDPCLYLYDLGSAHGTFVNKDKLPMRTYKKLSPFDNIKFGVSSRVFVLRCPQYEQAQQQQQAERQNQFSQMIQQQRRELSKQELKQRYMDMLENDPYFQANTAARTLHGKQQEEDEYEGIDWGITDQRQVYAYKNESDLPIEPDILRRLNLNETQLTKLAEYQDRFRKYQQVQNELNDLTAREKREFGLQEKLQNKKQKLEKKFVEALEAVEKSEDWLRANIFGETVDRDRKTVQIRQKQNDTFGDDEYLDRTLEKKTEPKKETETTQLSTEDYWRLEKQLKDNLKSLQESRERLRQLQQGRQKSQGEEKESEDELQAFMKDNNQNLDNQNITILQRQIQQLEQTVDSIKSKFKNVLGEQQINRIQPSAGQLTDKTIKDIYQQRSIQENLINAKLKMEQQHSIEQILSRLENAQHEDEELNQEDPAIFQYYKGGPKEDEEEIDDMLDEQKLINKARYEREYNPNKFEKPISKHTQLQTARTQPKVEQDEAVDLTKLS